ncbi:MAG: hypothetical protein ABW318_14410 [Vicinamibacterales bacterium]
MPTTAKVPGPVLGAVRAFQWLADLRRMVGQLLDTSPEFNAFIQDLNRR